VEIAKSDLHVVDARLHLISEEDVAAILGMVRELLDQGRATGAEVRLDVVCTPGRKTIEVSIERG
jgi:hypothetical protein